MANVLIKRKPKWKISWHKVIFRSSSIEGKAFDAALLTTIFISLITVMLQSVQEINHRYGMYFLAIEMVVTALFACEYIIRVFLVSHKSSYIFSYLGLMDLLAILPCYLSWIFWGSNYFLLLRVVRILRIFRIFELNQYTSEVRVLMDSIRASTARLTVFIMFIVTVVVVVGFLMYLLEGSTNEGFSSIPKSMYWAVVTLTTVGYGDITPQTGIGRIMATTVMLLGYGVLTISASILSARIAINSNPNTNSSKNPSDSFYTFESHQECKVCGFKEEDEDASFCKHCGNRMT